MDWEMALEIANHKKAQKKITEALLVYVGIHVGLRFSDLRTLTFYDLLNENGVILISEKKTQKKRKIVLKEEARKWIKECMLIKKASIEDHILVNRTKEPISITYANYILKDIEKEYGISHPVSTHSLRKTFGRRVYDLEPSEQRLLLLSDMFNHSTIRDTRRYLGIRQEEMNEIYINL